MTVLVEEAYREACTYVTAQALVLFILFVMQPIMLLLKAQSLGLAVDLLLNLHHLPLLLLHLQEFCHNSFWEVGNLIV